MPPVGVSTRTKIVTALARELAGFVWAVGQVSAGVAVRSAEKTKTTGKAPAPEPSRSKLSASAGLPPQNTKPLQSVCVRKVGRDSPRRRGGTEQSNSGMTGTNLPKDEEDLTGSTGSTGCQHAASAAETILLILLILSNRATSTAHVRSRTGEVLRASVVNLCLLF